MKIDISQVQSSGILRKGEEIKEFVIGNFNKTSGGIIVLTNKRLLYLKKPSIFSKGMDLVFSYSLGDILSVSLSGLIGKTVNVTLNSDGDITKNKILCKNAEIFSKKIIGVKEEYKEEQIIDAKRVIIEEGNKDDAMGILKKRLARGEITLEEFHQKVQRT